jgi:hypothetical protein
LLFHTCTHCTVNRLTPHFLLILYCPAFLLCNRFSAFHYDIFIHRSNVFQYYSLYCSLFSPVSSERPAITSLFSLSRSLFFPPSLSPSFSPSLCVCVCVCVCIHIYIDVCVYVCIYISIYLLGIATTYERICDLCPSEPGLLHLT